MIDDYNREGLLVEARYSLPSVTVTQLLDELATYREAVLDMHWFSHLAEVRCITRAWLKDYNHERPYESLANLPPIGFAKQREQKLKGENSTSDRY